MIFMTARRRPDNQIASPMEKPSRKYVQQRDSINHGEAG
ncbi:MAG: hypothetical protein OJF47_000192 [Nitrospira sp.]|nr:MAG: hypothetical protein OJF47_000192 [Nitrospira sp.]